MILIIPVVVLKYVKQRSIQAKYLRKLISCWSGFMLWLAGVRIIKTIPENFPEKNYTIVANHQGNFDILVILSSLPVIPAFIAKIELRKVPFLSTWMKAINCLFIDRTDSPGSRKKIMNRLKEQNHNPLILFPEGTRSRQEKLLPFRTGGLKMIYDSKTDVLPIRINGTYKIWEESKKITPGTVKIDVKSLLKAEEYSQLAFEDFVKEMKKLTGL